MQDDQYEHESQCEDYADYGADGYHPVALGQKFNHKYVVIQKLGWGHFSTVWLVQNQNNKQYGALKIQRSKDNHAQSALDQLQLLKAIRKNQENPEWLSYLGEYEKAYPELIRANLCQPLLLLDNFAHHGIHGKHYCSLFQILGPNLLDVVQHFEFADKRMPLWLIKKITIDVLLGLVYLHDYCDMIHTDLKPENIMIKLEAKQQEQLIESIKQYKVKPLSMKYLKNLQSSKNPKSKKKNEKKKLKKKQKKENEKKEMEGQNQQNREEKEEGEVSKQQKMEQEISKQESSELPKQTSESHQIQQQQPQNNKQIQEEKAQNKQASQEKEKEKEKQEKSDEKKEKKEKKEMEEQMVEEEQNMDVLKWKNVKIQLNNRLFFKIVDMGNACFSNHHFTEDIQTREYRAPEVIIGHPYSHNTDIWSLACTIFEMMTNNFLFKPKRIQGISKDEDHLYKITEVLGNFTKQFALEGAQSAKYFNKKGKLLNGHAKSSLSIRELLHEDFDYSLEDAVEAEQFLLPMLQLMPEKRVSAKQCLKHPWLWKN